MKALTSAIYLDFSRCTLMNLKDACSLPQEDHIASTYTVYRSTPLSLLIQVDNNKYAIYFGWFFCTAYFLELCDTIQDPFEFPIRIRCHLSITACNVRRELPWRPHGASCVSSEESQRMSVTTPAGSMKINFNRHMSS